MDAVLRDIVETFETGLGPFADPGVLDLARALPVALPRGEDLHVLVQGHNRGGLRMRPVLVTVIADELAVRASATRVDRWPIARCTVVTEQVKLAGVRIALRTPAAELAIHRAMPVDEMPRLAVALTGALAPSDDAPPCSRYPPVARLGAGATLYDDRIAFDGAPTRMLEPGVVARALELPSAGTAIRSVSRLMSGARGKPRHVLVDGPGWSQVAPAPETAPELADGFADAVNRWVAIAIA